MTVAVLLIVRAAPVAVAILSALAGPATIIAATVVPPPVPTAIAILTAAVPVLAAAIVIAVATGAALIAATLIGTTLVAAARATILAASILAATIRASATVASIPVGPAARLLGLLSLRRLRGRWRLRRGASTAVPVGPTATTVATITAIAARLALRLTILLLLALPTALPWPVWAFAARSTAVAITARAVLPLLALSDNRRSGTGFRRSPAQQRQSHGGRDQTLHFVLQEALCAAPALSLDNQHRLSRMNRI